MRQRRWDDAVRPRPGTRTAALWQTHYPVWLGADKRLSARPLALPGRVQVTGHVRVEEPDVDAVRIRLDTSGGYDGPLTACLLRSAESEPVFVAGTWRRGAHRDGGMTGAMTAIRPRSGRDVVVLGADDRHGQAVRNAETLRRMPGRGGHDRPP